MNTQFRIAGSVQVWTDGLQTHGKLWKLDHAKEQGVEGVKICESYYFANMILHNREDDHDYDR